MGGEQRSRTWIERYDLATGAGSAGLDLAGTYSALDVSGSGNTLAAERGGADDGGDLWVCQGGV